MDWENETYVRLFKRDTATWKMLPWQGRAILPLILRKLDRSGILELGDDGEEALAALIDMPIEVVSAGLPELLRRQVFRLVSGKLVMPNYLKAQESKQSDSQRKRESREKQRLAALQSQPVTSCPEQSQPVTFGHSDTTLNDTKRDNPDPPKAPQGGQGQLLPIGPPVARPKPEKIGIVPTPGFERFWREYPRHVAKQAAIKAWPGDTLLPAILKALEWQSDDFRARDPDRIPHPATWLNGKRWEDEKPTRPTCTGQQRFPQGDPPRSTPITEW